MTRVTAVHGDITTQAVDAIVNAANSRMRGGGGVDGAIHHAAGPTLLADCVRRFPNGMATGDAGWTTAGNLPARWVIHTVGPNHSAGERNRSLLESCYRRALEVADQLEVSTVAFPLISAGLYGWPLEDAIIAAVETLSSTPARVEEARLVGFDEAVYEKIERRLQISSALRVLQAVSVLHEQGYQHARVLPGMAASGMYWRVAIAPAENFDDRANLRDWDQALNYTARAGTEFLGTAVTAETSPGELARRILAALPALSRPRSDPPYVAWYRALLRLVDAQSALPIAYAEYFEKEPGWEIGWGSGVRHPHPPTPLP